MSLLITTPVNTSTGSGTPLVRASGVLRGYTTAPQDESSPLIALAFTGSFSTGQLTILSDVRGPEILYFLDTSPAGGNWIDTSSYDLATVAGLFTSALNALYGSDITITVDGDDSRFIQVLRNATGPSSRLQITDVTNLDLVVVSAAGGYGSEAISGSGQITEVILIPKIAGKTIKLTDLTTNGAGVSASIRFAFKDANNTYFRVSQEVYNGAYSFPARAGFMDEWLNGRADCDLVAYLTSTPTGGSVTCYAFAERY